ncbi:hypothetical protein L7F22_008223 [Adiantum nelumboides]|nr:hypothetical protein [Adiantum nelumboides]
MQCTNIAGTEDAEGTEDADCTVVPSMLMVLDIGDTVGTWGIFVGSIGAAYNKDELEKRRITHVLSVANMIEAMYPFDFKYKKVEVRDSADVDLEEHFDDCFAFINEARQSGGAVLVHCFAGRSRSVTVVVAYLMKTYGMNFSEALDLVRTKRPQAAPNPGFILQLKKFERRLSDEGLCTRACNP